MQTHFLLTKFDIVVDLVDFMLGSKSPRAVERNEKRPNMGAGMSSPPFEDLVALVSYLVRFSLTREMKGEQHAWNDTYNKPPSTLLGYQLKEKKKEEAGSDDGWGDGFEDEEEEKYPLSEEAFLFITNPDFMNRVLKEGMQCEEFGKALAHFCYKNNDFSKKVAKLVLKGISKNDYDKIKNYLDVVTQVALIKDEL